MRSPKISMLSEDIVKVRTHAGTGISTSSTFYYNAKKDVLSRWFPCVYDETDELLIYSECNKLIVRNIFDKTAYYCEFTKFKIELANVVEPFVNVEFVNNNKQIIVTYLTGDNIVETTEIIDLK